MVHVRIASLALDPRSNQPVIVLKPIDEEPGEGRLLPIWIGHPEATAILLAIEGVEPPRPMTHDLLCNVSTDLRAFDAIVPCGLAGVTMTSMEQLLGEPVPLARVGEGAIGAAWGGADLEALRAVVAKAPRDCEGCALGPACRGGCRGWAHYVTGSWEAVGPDCARRQAP